MLPVRFCLPVVLLLVVSAPAGADVVILKGNGSPLQGEIVSETETHVRFRIRGLAAGSHVDIRKDRIEMSWRDSPDPRALRRVPPRLRTGRWREPPSPRATTDREEPRTPEEIRAGLVDRVRERVDRLTPGSTATGSLALFVLLIYGTLVLWLGGRLVDLEELGLGQCSVLTLLTAILGVVDLYTYPLLGRSSAFAVLLVAEVVAWVLFVRLFSGEPVRKGVLLLSFLILGLGVTALVGLSVLAVV